MSTVGKMEQDNMQLTFWDLLKIAVHWILEGKASVWPQSWKSHVSTPIMGHHYHLRGHTKHSLVKLTNAKQQELRHSFEQRQSLDLSRR